jgi:hypothetical protein
MKFIWLNQPLNISWGIFWFHLEAGMLKGICWATGPKSVFVSGRHWDTIRFEGFTFLNQAACHILQKYKDLMKSVHTIEVCDMHEASLLMLP